MDIKDIVKAATALAESANTDVYFYNGDITSQFEAQFVLHGATGARRENVLLVLCTRGGSPDAAYRMARFLQRNYKKFTLLITGHCKSSGTLIALGAHEIVMGDQAELGPLDIQLGKKDELWENDSGLTVVAAITELENKAYELFENGFVKLKFRTEGRMTTRTATSLATELATGIVGPIVSQIDPMHVGEVSRAMKVAKEYGERLSKRSKNLQINALHRLINDYPSHGFVIDRDEAKELFSHVRQPNAAESALIAAFPSAALSSPGDDAFTFVVSMPRKETPHESSNQDHAGPDSDQPAAGLEPAAGSGQEQPEPDVGNVTPITQAGASH